MAKGALARTDALARLLIGLSAHPAAPAAWLSEDPDLCRAELHQATGLVAAQLDISPAHALVRIRAYAYSHTRPLLDTARDILAGRVHPSRDRDADGRAPDNGS